MRIGFRHCLLSSCLFRCGAGSLRGAAEPQPGWQTRLPHRRAQPCSHASPAPTLATPHSLPCPSCRRGQRCRCVRHRVPTAGVPQGRFLSLRFEIWGEKSRINVNKCDRMVWCHHSVMKSSGSWAGWWKEMGIAVVFLLLSFPVAY